jgi:sugar (pentulose or hexulose) kinase
MYLGLDLGTSSVKVAIFDEAGIGVAESSAACVVDTTAPGRAEALPADWWRALASAMAQLPAHLRSAVRAVGLSGQMHGVVMVNAQAQVLRPAILWMDQRTGDELSRYPRRTLELTGNPPTPGMAGPILAWLSVHEAQTLAAARWALQPKDWLGLTLTGEAATDPSDCSATLLSDRGGCWHASLIDELQLPSRLFAPCHPSFALRGALLPQPAAALGLRPGVPVAVGAGDTAAAAFGSGLYDSGDAQLTTGSGAQLIVMQARPPHPTAGLNAYCAVAFDAFPGWYAMAAMQNCGVALEWARGVLGLSWPEAYARAFREGKQADQLCFVPYLNGERSPWMDPKLRAGWHGLGAADDAGSLMRAAFFGVAFAIRAGLDALRASGLPVEGLRLAGGGSVHPAWQQTLIDVLDLPLSTSMCANASVRGAALLAAAAHGMRVEELRALRPPVRPLGTPMQQDRHGIAYQHFLRSVPRRPATEDAA